MQHGDGNRIDDQRVAGSGGAPRNADAVQRSEVLPVEGRRERLPWLEHERWVQRTDHRGATAHVIGISMGDHEGGQSSGAASTKKRHHDVATRIRGRAPGAGINKQPLAQRCPYCDRVALTHIQDVDLQVLAPCAHRRYRDNREDPAHTRSSGEEPDGYHTPHRSTPPHPHQTREHDDPRSGESEARRPDKMSPGQLGTERGHSLQHCKHQSGTAREQLARDQASEDAGHGKARERYCD